MDRELFGLEALEALGQMKEYLSKYYNYQNTTHCSTANYKFIDHFKCLKNYFIVQFKSFLLLEKT